MTIIPRALVSLGLLLAIAGLASAQGNPRANETAPTVRWGESLPVEGNPIIEDAVVSIVPEPAGLPPIASGHGDWQVRCDATPQGKRCALIQSVAGATPEVGLTVVVLHGAAGAGALLRVVVPNGVLLPPGLGLRIDGTDLGRAAFTKCPTTGCIAEVSIDNDIIYRMKTGHTATFIIFQIATQGIGIPISLNGFAEGFENLP